MRIKSNVMKKAFLITVSFFLFLSCQQKENPVFFKKYDETIALEKQQNHQNGRMKFKLFQSKYLDMNEVFEPFINDLANFSEQEYESLKPYILENDIPSIQKKCERWLFVL